MIPHRLFSGQRVVGLAFFVAFVAGMNFYSLLNFYPLTFAAVYNPDPVQIGLKGLGYGVSVTVGAVLFNALLSVPQIEARYILLVAAVLMSMCQQPYPTLSLYSDSFTAAFGGAIAAATPDNAKLTVALGTIAGFGVGGILVPSATVALICVPDDLLATAAALSLSIRTIGGSIGYTIYFSIFSNKLATILPEKVGQYAVAAGLSPDDATAFVTAFLTTPGLIADAPGYSPSVAAAATVGSRWAYAESLKYVWLTSMAFGVLAILSCTAIPSIKAFQTNRIAVTL